ncbi:MAG: hypothetical protein IPP69_15130 [Flavobacteriales bacterium]|nr:hypothetical protein [Flavobacteriales bacterium]
MSALVGKPVIATTRVPLQIPVFTVNTVTQSEQTNQNGYTELVHKFDLRWLDTPGQEDLRSEYTAI